MESTFSKMKKTALFINMGKGVRFNEDHLLTALKNKQIGGAILDAIKQEPADDSELWKEENAFISHVYADDDENMMLRGLEVLGENI